MTNANSPIDAESWLHMYEQMCKIRAFEETSNELYTSARMPGLAHLYIGEEAVAVGVCEALRREDYITSTHRGHGHCLAKGAALDRMFAELLGKADGYCRGKGGSMHIADQETGNLGANAIVGGSTGIATGAALSIKMRGTDQVAVCFFGDGALGQGLLYESMNMAQLWKLPVIYVCENNLYGEYTHHSEAVAGDMLGRARAFGIHAVDVDGQDVAPSTRRPANWWNAPAAAKDRPSCSAIPIASAAITWATSAATTTAAARKKNPGDSATRSTCSAIGSPKMVSAKRVCWNASTPMYAAKWNAPSTSPSTPSTPTPAR
ncbi:MAG: thiamine pyrophosphate-dependent dehydrogenase E1 component subunit alpha [Caldilineaceae bacterium]